MVWFLRVLLAVFVVEVGGVAALAVDLGFGAEAACSDCCSDCPFEKGGQECPPGCLSCHCAHGGALLSAVPESPPIRFAEMVGRLDAPDRSVLGARAPPLPSVYRPPRALTIV